MSEVKRNRSRKVGSFIVLLIILVIISMILIWVPLLPISDVPNCFTVSCDPNITFESVWERYN